MSINKKWFIEKINSFLTKDESNKMTRIDGSLLFDPNVLIGFVSGIDPIFKEYKKVIGEFHLTPSEVYEWYCKKNDIQPSFDNISVLSFILPINKNTKKQNLEYSKEWPSERWANTRLFGEIAIQKLQKYLVNELKTEGINAIAPSIEKNLFSIFPAQKNSVWTSTWSERHVAFAAGLGSFGLSDGFINERGIAMRCGSIVLDYRLRSDADKRPSDPYKYCINCGECIKRCPVGAISFENRHNKIKCAEQVFKTIPYVKKNFGINIYSCGLCQVGVPCENGIPEPPAHVQE